MLVKVAELTKNKGTTFRYDFLLPLKDMDEAEIQTPEPVKVSVEAVYLGMEKGILVAGSLDSRSRARCHRCMDEFELAFSGDFREEVNLESETACVPEPDSACLGETIDLARMARDHWILAIPLKLLCREDCRGICSLCGRDLAEGACSCGEETLDPRLEKLKELLKD